MCHCLACVCLCLLVCRSGVQDQVGRDRDQTGQHVHQAGEWTIGGGESNSRCVVCEDLHCRSTQPMRVLACQLTLVMVDLC